MVPGKLRKVLKPGAATVKSDVAEGSEPEMKFKEYDGRHMHNVRPCWTRRQRSRRCRMCTAPPKGSERLRSL